MDRHTYPFNFANQKENIPNPNLPLNDSENSTDLGVPSWPKHRKAHLTRNLLNMNTNNHHNHENNNTTEPNDRFGVKPFQYNQLMNPVNSSKGRMGTIQRSMQVNSRVPTDQNIQTTGGQHLQPGSSHGSNPSHDFNVIDEMTKNQIVAKDYQVEGEYAFDGTRFVKITEVW